MSDDEPDYLSDDFLAQCVPNDVRPGLLFNHDQKRKHELRKQQERTNAEHRGKYKSRKQIEQERREEGLNKAIGEDNKGFQMLQKMGFKPETGIGRSHDGGATAGVSKLKEPIQIEVKSDRKGLGEKSKKEENRQQVEEWRQRLSKMSDPDEYRSRLRNDVALKETKWDLKKAQTTCKTLNIPNGVLEPWESWYWPAEIKPQEEDEDKEDEAEAETAKELEPEPEPEPDEQLLELTRYLRKEYFYCIWCGTSYTDSADLRESCPGNSRQEH